METTEGVKVFAKKKKIKTRPDPGWDYPNGVLNISRFIDRLFPKGYTFIRP